MKTEITSHSFGVVWGFGGRKATKKLLLSTWVETTSLLEALS